MRKFILDGEDPRFVDDQGLTALHYAAINGSEELARILVKHGPAGFIIQEAPGGVTSLWVACLHGHLGVAKILIEAEKRSFLRLTRKQHRLSVACQKGHLEIVETLIKVGGEPFLFKTEKERCTCLHIACHKRHLLIAKAD